MGVLAEQFVGAYHDVDGAVCHTFECGGDFLAGSESAHFGHLDRPFGKPVDQGLVMLLGQQRGGGQQGHLLAAGDGHKGGAQGHFGLAKTHVAADQAVHRAWADHVLNHRMDGGFLVSGFFKTKFIGEGLVVGR